MKGGNEQKNSTKHHLLNFLVKPPRTNEKVRSKSSVHQFNYQLPRSFFKAVDNARIEAGYDILPRLHHLSLSPSPQRPKSLSSSTEPSKRRHQHAHSSSNSDTHNASVKKVQFRQTNHKHSHHHHHNHRQKKIAESSSAGSLVRKSASNAPHRTE